MKAIQILVLSFAMSALFVNVSNAQTRRVQAMEGEVRAGFTTPVGGYHAGKAEVCMDLGVELRYNFREKPWDCGLMLELSSAKRGYGHLFEHGNDRYQNNRTLALAFTSHYNFLQGRKVNPYGGVALGVAFNDVVGDKFYPSNGISPFVSPRIGVELFSHVRIGTEFNVCRKGYHNFALTLGLVVGGRPKKQK